MVDHNVSVMRSLLEVEGLAPNSETPEESILTVDGFNPDVIDLVSAVGISEDLLSGVVVSVFAVEDFGPIVNMLSMLAVNEVLLVDCDPLDVVVKSELVGRSEMCFVGPVLIALSVVFEVVSSAPGI